MRISLWRQRADQLGRRDYRRLAADQHRRRALQSSGLGNRPRNDLCSITFARNRFSGLHRINDLAGSSGREGRRWTEAVAHKPAGKIFSQSDSRTDQRGDTVKNGIAGYLTEYISRFGVNRRTAHRRNGVGRADVNFVPRSHELAGHVDENRARVEFNGRPCAATRKIFFPDLKTTQLSNRYGRFSAEENARQGFLSSIDYVADDDTVLDPQRGRGG